MVSFSWSICVSSKWIDLTNTESRTLILAELQVCDSSIMPWFLSASARISVPYLPYYGHWERPKSRRLRSYGFLPGFLLSMDLAHLNGNFLSRLAYGWSQTRLMTFCFLPRVFRGDGSPPLFSIPEGLLFFFSEKNDTFCLVLLF